MKGKGSESSVPATSPARVIVSAIHAEKSRKIKKSERTDLPILRQLTTCFHLSFFLPKSRKALRSAAAL